MKKLIIKLDNIVYKFTFREDGLFYYKSVNRGINFGYEIKVDDEQKAELESLGFIIDLEKQTISHPNEMEGS